MVMSSGDVSTETAAPGDRLVVRLDAGGPIELSGLTDSFAALARLYERHRKPEGEPASKLFVTRLETGSIIAEIAPLAMMLGQALPMMDASMKVGEFAGRLSKAINAFSGIADAQITKADLPSRDDARDIREFIKPITGRASGSLTLKHARFAKRGGDTETIIEYEFDENALNRAAINIDQALSEPELLSAPHSERETQGIVREVMLFFDQASRAPGKEAGRTGDKGTIPDISEKALPVHFRKGVNDLKEQMVRGDLNPLNNTFVVDVHVQYVNGQPKGYIVTELHKVIPNDE